MGIIAFIILGAIAGAIAKALLPGDDPGGFIVTTLIGIVGAILGGFLAAALFDAVPDGRVLRRQLTWLTGDRRLDRPAGLIYRAVRAALRDRALSIRLRCSALEGKRLTAARERAHGREPPAVLAPDVGEDAQRLVARSRRRGGRGPRRGGSAAAGRSPGAIETTTACSPSGSRARTPAARRPCSGGCGRRGRARRPPRRARRARGSASRPASCASARERRADGGGG